MARLPTVACLSACAMLRALFKEGIVLGHKISKNEIEVDKAKIDVIAKLPHPTTIKEYSVRFLRRLYPSFPNIEEKLTKAPILIAPNWDLPFEFMFDASDFSIGAVLGKRHEKHFKPIHYASKMMNDAETNYTTTENEMLAVVYAFEKFRSYWIMNKIIVHTDHSAFKYLFAKKDAKARLLRITRIVKSLGLSFIRASHPQLHFKNPVMLKYGVTHRLSTAYHPQTSGQVEAFRTSYKTPIGCTPYNLVYGKACHLPIKLEHKAYWALKQANFDLAIAGDHQKVQLNELNELRDHAYEN
nr:reverse transcriptase domain-containing protein [Tanacetum cinerariifolium]